MLVEWVTAAHKGLPEPPTPFYVHADFNPSLWGRGRCLKCVFLSSCTLSAGTNGASSEGYRLGCPH